jgi:signal transduction histidine kinase
VRSAAGDGVATASDAMDAERGLTPATTDQASERELLTRIDTLLARVDALEQERRRSFDAAQREADALFAQYQLSQLIASGGSLADLASAVLLELIRLADADGGALWIGAAGSQRLDRVASVGSPVTRGRALILSEEPPVTVLVVWPVEGRPLDSDGLRVAQLARHELAVAFAGARLRETLEQERHELGAIVDGATDLILQVDADGRVVRLNPAGERLLGITATAAMGRTCGDVLGCDVQGGHGTAACPLVEVRTTGVPIAYRETAVRGPAEKAIQVAGSYAAAPGGGTARATAILRDISAIHALDELREGFVATVSHELRTPLALIRGYAESLLHLDLEPDQQRAYVQRIDDASGRLTTLVDQVLDVTHLQADPLILERSPTTLAALVARLRGDLAVSGGAERLVVEARPDLPLLEVDVARAGQILNNLVGNALKYAPDGSPVVVSAERDGSWLLVSVEDEGVGVPEADRTLVTEPFHRAWNVRESRIPGTGLGLFICLRLVEAHGGRLWLEDRPDGQAGTRGNFTLPLAPRRGGPSRG